MVLGLGGWFAYGLVAWFWRRRIGLKRRFSDLPIFHGEARMQFDQSGLSIEAPQYKVEVSWSAFDAFAETENLILLSRPPGFVMIPKRSFDPAQLATFRSALGSNLRLESHARSTRGFLLALAAGIALLLLLYAALRIFSAPS